MPGHRPSLNMWRLSVEQLVQPEAQAQRMKKQGRLLLPIIVALLATVCVVVVLSRRLSQSAAVDLKIEVAGTPGAWVEVIFTVDGGSRPAQSDTLPATFQFARSRTVEFSIRREAGPGQLVATFFVNGERKGVLGGSTEWVRGIVERDEMSSWICGPEPDSAGSPTRGTGWVQ